ncbi:MAG: glycoside hydrolase family 3 C-terminal domain-containing protein [Prevotella sp.]|nr:glycoside hydrolase family 3 C-terminal domain-containing protein [Prevotella sp.]
MRKRGLLILSMMMAIGSAHAQSYTYPFQNPALSAEQRAEDLCKRLTLEEKTQLMMDGSKEITRLGVPHFEWWNEALHGIGRNGFATVFPITMAMAASWDDALLHQVFTAVSDEARAKNTLAKQKGNPKRYQGLSFWTPNINIFRDPRWGRGQETYGEDPFLTTKMGLAVVRGLQGMTYEGEWLWSPTGVPATGKYKKLLACAKHFAVHSGPEWNRHQFNLENLPSRDLWETYLPAFKSLVQDGEVAEVMCAYQRIDGEPCCGNSRYEQQILRDEWGFKGLITSDCGAISDFWKPGYHGFSPNVHAASASAVRAGTDVECGSNYRSLPDAVKAGEVTEGEIDKSLKRLLVARFELGDFDPDEMVAWTKVSPNVIACPAHKQLALDMARKSIVLLQNRDGILPLKKSQKVVVMGPNANDSVMMWGNYSGYPTQTTTILKGIRDKMGYDVKYVPGCGFTRNETFESRFNCFTTMDGQRGMNATYWNNTDMKGDPVNHLVISQPINLSNGGATVFAPGVNLEKFSAQYQGRFNPTADETLIISMGSDDKARLIVNGDTLIDNWKGRNRINETRKEIRVKAGEAYQFQIDYVQDFDMAVMQFDICKKLTPTHQEVVNEVADADVVVFVGGISPRLEGEEMKVNEPGFRGGDRTDIELPQAQRDLIAALHKAGKHVVFVNCSGSAVALVPETENADAILQAWYGGEQGGKAVADVLFGDYNPQGKLPVTFYKNVNQLPDYEDYMMANRTYRYFKDEPLFPFGYGLSYTQYRYSKPKYNAKKGIVTVNVTNAGNRDGEETVQVYMRRLADIGGPLKTLRAYRQVSLKAGETKVVEIPFAGNDFETWDEQTNTMRVVKGKHELMVGGSSKDTDLQRLVVNL